MPDWNYEDAYKGAPPPWGLLPLSRPLYPPDAAERGKKPSPDGPDCEAIRRVISRLGRAPWEWATGDNKRKWSNTLAHGAAGGNVGESGVAGYQRQQNLDATGWWGSESHKSSQYALIPEGLPNEGQHGWDATATDLYRKAVEQYKGDTSTVRKAALAEAKSYLGYTESPAGTNCNMFGAAYGMNYEPWCFMFVTYCFEKGTSGGSPTFALGSRYAYCPYGVDDSRNKRNGLSVTHDPHPGDLVFYDWSRDGVFDHVGIFESGTAFSWKAIEGNTSTSNNSNGGEVMRRTRSANDANVVFSRVAEP